jgi:hypothetical protein
MPILTKIYKIKKENSLSEQVFTLKRAREICKKLRKKGKKAEPVVYKENVILIDLTPDGEVIYFREYNESEKM